MTQQTAVEWLVKIYLQTNKIDSFDIEQAKEMEKEQLNIAKIDGINLANKGYGSKGSVFLEGYEQIDQNNPITRGSTALVEVKSSQTEISDEEIEKFASDFYDSNGSESIFIMGAKWYREQLKKK